MVLSIVFTLVKRLLLVKGKFYCMYLYIFIYRCLLPFLAKETKCIPAGFVEFNKSLSRRQRNFSGKGELKNDGSRRVDDVNQWHTTGETLE